MSTRRGLSSRSMQRLCLNEHIKNILGDAKKLKKEQKTWRNQWKIIFSWNIVHAVPRFVQTVQEDNCVDVKFYVFVFWVLYFCFCFWVWLYWSNWTPLHRPLIQTDAYYFRPILNSFSTFMNLFCHLVSFYPFGWIKLYWPKCYAKKFVWILLRAVWLFDVLQSC